MVDYDLAAYRTSGLWPTALHNVQKEFGTKEVEQWVRSDMERTELREKIVALEKTVRADDNEEPKEPRFEAKCHLGEDLWDDE